MRSDWSLGCFSCVEHVERTHVRGGFWSSCLPGELNENNVQQLHHGDWHEEVWSKGAELLAGGALPQPTTNSLFTAGNSKEQRNKLYIGLITRQTLLVKQSIHPRIDFMQVHWTFFFRSQLLMWSYRKKGESAPSSGERLLCARTVVTFLLVKGNQ